MALEITAAIVGLLAAAEKVAETLGPIVSAFVQAPKHAQRILTELQHTQTILSGLKALSEKLTNSPHRRRELIRLDQVIAATTDGVLLFDELEALVDQLGENLKGFTRSRTKWARHKDELEHCASRLLSFKISIGLMLNILQCDLDVDAQRDHGQLLAHTSTLLAQNLDLADRMDRLERRHHDGNSILTYRPASLLSTATVVPTVGNTRQDGKASMFSLFPLRSNWSTQYEHELKASRVYRKAQQGVDDVSVRKSIALSHAWSALSDISLSDISALSVVALPIFRSEITNAYHYSTQASSDGSPGVELEPTLPNIQFHTWDWPPDRSLARAQGFPRLSSLTTPPPSLPPTFPLSTELKLVVIGTPEADICTLVAKSANPSSGSEHHLASTYTPASQSTLNGAVNFTNQIVEVDDQKVRLDIQIVNELPGATYVGVLNEHLRLGHMFILVYSATSRESFDNIVRYQRLIYQCKATAWYPMMVVGNHVDVNEDGQISPFEGSKQALFNGSLFDQASENCSAEDIHQMFSDVVRLRWHFESMDWDDLKDHWQNCNEEICERKHRKLFGQLLQADRKTERDAREAEAKSASVLNEATRVLDGAKKREETREKETKTQRKEKKKSEAWRKRHFETTQRAVVDSRESPTKVKEPKVLGIDTCAVNEAQRKARDKHDEQRYEQTKQKLAMLVAGHKEPLPEPHMQQSLVQLGEVPDEARVTLHGKPLWLG